MSHEFPLTNDAVRYMLQIAGQRGENIIAKAGVNPMFNQQVSELAHECLVQLYDAEESVPILKQVFNSYNPEQSDLQNIKIIANALLKKGFNPRIISTLNSELILKELSEQEVLLTICSIISSNSQLPLPKYFSSQSTIQWLENKDYQRVFSRVEQLYIANNFLFTTFPPQVAVLSNLKSINIINCPNLKKLPSGIKYLENISELSIDNCRNFSEITDEIGELKELRSLKLSYCLVSEFPDAMKSLKNLQVLTFDHCPCLESLPAFLAEFPQLEYITIRSCRKLKNFPPELLARPIGIQTYHCPSLIMPKVMNQQATLFINQEWYSK